MVGRAQAYWLKSIENRDVFTQAVQAGHYNAAASRYYYALRLAAMAFFEVIGTRASKYPGGEPYWHHDDLIREIGKGLETKSPGIEADRWFREARKLREQADYRVNAPRQEVVDRLVKKASKIFKAIQDEITAP